MGVVGPLGSSLIRVKRDGNRMSHPLASAHNQGGKTSYLHQGLDYPSALEQHGTKESQGSTSGFTISFLIVGKKNPQ